MCELVPAKIGSGVCETRTRGSAWNKLPGLAADAVDIAYTSMAYHPPQRVGISPFFLSSLYCQQLMLWRLLCAVVLIRVMEMPMSSAAPGAHFPVQNRSLSLDIKGNKTDIVISKYEDTFLVIVTQIGCMGTILAAKKEESVFSDPTYNVSVLFGKRDEGTLKDISAGIIENRLW
ncbi:hypothetical protein PR202_gb07985 [Eleusine coracana subsp. coracana]|uniref:Proteasome assembly chaperone 3 n=1 Tax=Eleusine coracana subsp. coracana TaxID=191504 RepID=A0AAV5EDI4_ELECO|nr:hypothetical protein PR202_gb07985 [Eleusine coracana subsp. coracana]